MENGDVPLISRSEQIVLWGNNELEFWSEFNKAAPPVEHFDRNELIEYQFSKAELGFRTRLYWYRSEMMQKLEKRIEYFTEFHVDGALCWSLFSSEFVLRWMEIKSIAESRKSKITARCTHWKLWAAHCGMLRVALLFHIPLKAIGNSCRRTCWIYQNFSVSDGDVG